MGFRYNDGQAKIIKAGIEHARGLSGKQVFEYRGPAGTGKSVVMDAIAKGSGIPIDRIAAMAYIGQAAIIMRSKGFTGARSIHSWLYEPVDVPLMKDGKPVLDPIMNTPMTKLEFIPKDLTDDIDIFFIDEGWTVPYSMKAEIESRGKKIIVGGDYRQLPPVADKPAYLYGDDVMELDQIMRQAEGSGIIYIADRLYNGLPVYTGEYGNDCLVIYEDELDDSALTYADMVVCGTNRTRDAYNNYIRNNIRGFDSKLPQYGESVICRKNDWKTESNGIALANGLCGLVTNPIDITTFKGGVFNMDFKPFMFNSQFDGIDVDYNYLNGDKDLRELLKSSPFARGHKFEYAYALTTHLAQGAQYPNVVAVQEYISPEINNNLWYTAATRATNKLIFALHRKKYY